jgi:hypothetical protein
MELGLWLRRPRRSFSPSHDTARRNAFPGMPLELESASKSISGYRPFHMAIAGFNAAHARHI